MATTSTTWLLTGATAGIGLGLAKTLLSRPNTTLIAGVRDLTSQAAQSLATLPVANSSKLIIVQIDSGSDTDASTAVHSLQHDHGITGIDVVIANAGVMTDLDPITTVSPGALRDSFQINAIAPLLLFRATLPLLLRASTGNPRFIVTGSLAGSIALGPKAGSFAAYGSSKAAVNYVVSEIHAEHGDDLTAVAIHPGLVDTRMGKRFAEASGYPLFTIEEGVKMFLEQIENASRESQAGGFIDYHGKTVPW